VIAAVVIGGTGLYGGQGKILRTIIGVIIIALTRNFLNLARIVIFCRASQPARSYCAPFCLKRCNAASPNGVEVRSTSHD
jgi:hypothetical protein